MWATVAGVLSNRKSRPVDTPNRPPTSGADLAAITILHGDGITAWHMVSPCIQQQIMSWNSTDFAMWRHLYPCCTISSWIPNPVSSQATSKSLLGPFWFDSSQQAVVSRESMQASKASSHPQATERIVTRATHALIAIMIQILQRDRPVSRAANC